MSLRAYLKGARADSCVDTLSTLDRDGVMSLLAQRVGIDGEGSLNILGDIEAEILEIVPPAATAREVDGTAVVIND